LIFRAEGRDDDRQIHVGGRCLRLGLHGRSGPCRRPRLHARQPVEHAIDQFYASPVDVNDWKEDILGQDILEAGNFARITIKDGRDVCTYDLKIVFIDGEELDEPGIDLCETGSYTVTDPGE